MRYRVGDFDANFENAMTPEQAPDYTAALSRLAGQIHNRVPPQIDLRDGIKEMGFVGVMPYNLAPGVSPLFYPKGYQGDLPDALRPSYYPPNPWEAREVKNG
jgi:hypothetical protein